MSCVPCPPWEPRCSSRRCIRAGTAAEGCPGPSACVLPAGSLSASSRNADPASGLQQHWLCSAGSPAHHTTAFAGKNQPAEISPLAGSRSFVMLLSATVINPHLLCQLLP